MKLLVLLTRGGLSDVKNDVVTGLIYLPFHNGTSYNQ